MSKKEVIAYAITHAPKGVKGGPYEDAYDKPVPTLREAWRGNRRRAKYWLAIVRRTVPHARVIRIVRKARPSEPMSRMPDPMPVVRAAMAWRDWDATPDTTTDADLSAAVDAYRTLAALDDEYQAAVAATKGEGE